MTHPPPRFLVTAGNTRERIDDVRDWGNIFTGNTGFDIARALAQFGPVDLLTSNSRHLEMLQSGAVQTPCAITGWAFNRHAELLGALEARVPRGSYRAIFMTAAVADYRPVRTYSVLKREKGDAQGEERWVVKDVQAGKVKSNHEAIAVLGEQTEKIVDRFRVQWGYRGLLVKFKLEVGVDEQRLIEIGQASRRHSGADYLVANTLAMVGGEKPGAYLLSDAGEQWIARSQLAARLAELVRLV